MENYSILCPACSKEINKDSEFCVRCGIRITAEEREKQHNKFIQKREEEKEEEERLKKQLNSQKEEAMQLKKQEFERLPKLIECPDCEKDISIRAINCVHCGRPMDDNPFAGMSLKTERTQFDISKIKEIEKEIESITSDIEKQFIENDNIENSRVPACPHCGSENFEKTGLSKKVGMALLGGIYASGTIGKTFRCFNCNYRW